MIGFCIGMTCGVTSYTGGLDLHRMGLMPSLRSHLSYMTYLSLYHYIIKIILFQIMLKDRLL